jgi:hypothetical protein
MSRKHILIDDDVLHRNLQAFLRTPAGSKVRDSFDMPLWLCLFAGMMLFCAGMCMLPTIVWTLAGVQMLGALLRFEFLKPAWENGSRKPELLRPLVGYGIIIGPSGKYGLVLGTFRPSREYSPAQLEELAQFLGGVYSGRNEDPRLAELAELLRDDSYQANRRRRVPEPYAEGLELYLFDVEIDPHKAILTDEGTPLFLFAAEPGEKGEIAQVPAAVGAGAIHLVPA